jgi:hypothetical protein
MSRGTVHRLHAVLRIRRALSLTRQLGEALAGRGFLEPWPLDFDLTTRQRARIDDLLVVRPSAFQDTALIDLLRTFGVEAASFLTMHRISLFRIASLLHAARAAVAEPAVPAAQETLA